MDKLRRNKVANCIIWTVGMDARTSLKRPCDSRGGRKELSYKANAACQESKSETMLTVEEEEETETDPDVSTTSGNLLCRMGRH